MFARVVTVREYVWIMACKCGADTVLNYAKMPPFPICVCCGEIPDKCKNVIGLLEQEPEYVAPVSSEPVEPWKQYRCPYCLFVGPRYKFETIRKNGKVSKKLHCPDCKANFLMSSDCNEKNVE